MFMTENRSIPDVQIWIIENESENGASNFTKRIVSSAELFEKGRSVIFSLPGAFTPTCTNRQVPDYESSYGQLLELGVDRVVCLSVNDAFVMRSWAKDLDVRSVSMAADVSGDFTRLMGMMVRKDNIGLGLRSWRYACIVEAGKIVAYFVEPGLRDEAIDDPYEVSSPKSIISWLVGRKAPNDLHCDHVCLSKSCGARASLGKSR